MTKCGTGRKLRDHHPPSPPPCSPCSPRPGRALSCATPLHTSAKPHHRSICAETHATSWNRSRDFPLSTPGRAPPAPKRFPQVSVPFEGRARGRVPGRGTTGSESHPLPSRNPTQPPGVRAGDGRSRSVQFFLHRHCPTQVSPLGKLTFTK